MDPQISLCCESARPCNEQVKDGDLRLNTFSEDQTAVQLPAEKQPRRWAAWTRQEEESFFTALRQVGKNFEKITSRVQSKNKDQVRHYYYRLVRRMNKLLGPDLSLDATNSKETIAAMLRWWSLLEKFSCKASKLHLKPRRFRIFVEKLESQVSRDRKRNVRRRISQGENSSSPVQSAVLDHAKTLAYESRPVKLISADGQNVKKFRSGKGSSPKHQVNMGLNCKNCKTKSPTKAANQRQKIGIMSTTAYKRWEKAAIAGVSLVADAAEHLERLTTDKQVEDVQDTERNGAHSLLTLSQNLFDEKNIQNSTKLKLQLFPIDDGTRRSLEMNAHNPFLELTLSTRKKISSVLEHLNRKWGTSSKACQELLLFPYYVQSENFEGYPKWSKDSTLTAADVYALVGSPPVFRLRYGWLSTAELGAASSRAPFLSAIPTSRDMNMNIMQEQNGDAAGTSSLVNCHEAEKVMDHQNDQLPSNSKSAAELLYLDALSDTPCCIGKDAGICVSSSEQAPAVSLQGRVNDAGTSMVQVENEGEFRKNKFTLISSGDWADSLTNISIGDLLSEASHEKDSNCINSHVCDSSRSPEQLPFSCDSFDAAIAAHVYKHQIRVDSQLALESHASSVLDAEETCDAFAFRKNEVFHREAPDAPRIFSAEATIKNKEFLDAEQPIDDDLMRGDLMDADQSDPHAVADTSKDLGRLSDIYWSDSLGPLDLDLSSCRCRGEGLIFTDSLGGFDRLLASSIDAFQNCSFSGLDKRKSASAVEACESVPISDHKIGSEV